MANNTQTITVPNVVQQNTRMGYIIAVLVGCVTFGERGEQLRLHAEPSLERMQLADASVLGRFADTSHDARVQVNRHPEAATLARNGVRLVKTHDGLI